MQSKREQWVCPKCGRRLHIPHQEHVCGHFDLDSYLAGKDPIAYDLMDWILENLRGREPLDVLPMKTMVGFQARSNFAFIRAKRKGVELSLVLSRPIAHPLLTRIDPYGPKKSFYRFAVSDVAELERPLQELLQEAYETGS